MYEALPTAALRSGFNAHDGMVYACKIRCSNFVDASTIVSA